LGNGTEREESTMHHPDKDNTSTSGQATLSANQLPHNDEPASSSRCLRPKEAASHLGISRAKLYELITSGELESITIGRSRRVPLGALADYVSKRRAIIASQHQPSSASHR
jgi:excisionase family DNA binding protein